MSEPLPEVAPQGNAPPSTGQFTLKDLFAFVAVLAVALGGIPTAYRSPRAALVTYLVVGAAQIALSVVVYKRRPAPRGDRIQPSEQPYELALLGSGATLGTWLLAVVWLAGYWLSPLGARFLALLQPG